MVDKTCMPACEQNVAGELPIRPDTALVATPVPAPTIVVEGENCAGAVPGLAHYTVEAIIPSGTVIYTRKCPDELEFDHSVMCALDGTKVIVVTKYSPTGVPTASFYTLAGASYVGDPALLVACDIDVESDPLPWCDAGQDVTQWVVKSDGAPTGTVFWTDYVGAIIAAPVAATRGVCAVPCVLPARGVQPTW